MSTALIAYSKQSGIQLSVADSAVSNIKSNGINGTYSTDEALKTLLAGTGLTYEYVSKDAVSVHLGNNMPVRGDRNSPTSRNEVYKNQALEEITVTAQRVEQSLQKVPVAVSAFSGDDLTERQVVNMQDIERMVPNLYLEENLSNTSTPKIFMRGIGQANSAFSFDSPVGIYVDDVYYARVIGSMIDFFDVDRVEVLRGPQGTIYGRNSSIGAIRVVTKKPPLDEMDLKADATFGSKQTHNARLAIGVPLIEDKLGFRFAYNTKNNNGYQTNLTKNEKVKADNINAFRSQLLFKASDDLSIIFRGEYLRDRSRETAAANFINNPDLLTFESNRSYGDGTAVNKLDTYGASMTVDWSLGDTKLTSISAWRGIDTKKKFDTDGTTAASFEVDRGDLHERELTQEVFASGSLQNLPIDWVGGAFFLHEKNHYVWSLQIFAPPTVQYFDQTIDSIAGYLQGTYHVTDKLGLTAGGRYTYEHKTFDATGYLADGTFDFSYSDHDLETKKWTWRAALEYQLQDSILLYASAATGFRSGGLNGNAQSLAEVTGGAFGPEDTLMYEAGVKGDFLDRRLRLNASYYIGKYDNLQLAIVRDNGMVSNTNNSAKVHGLELEATALPFEGLEISGTLGTFNHDIENSPLKLPNAAKFNWSLRAAYTHDVTDIGKVIIGGNYSWSDKVFLNVNNDPHLITPSHGILDAHVSFLTNDEHWQVTLTGYNLTDKIYPIGGFYIAGGFLSAVKYPNLPRRWALTVRYKY